MPPNLSRAVALAHLVGDLCQFRRGPEDMPYSPALLVLLVAASIVLDVATGALFGGGDVLARSLVSTALVLALSWAALEVRKLGNRYVQTASAIVACGLAFSLLALPLGWLAHPIPAAATALTPMQVLLGWAVLALFVWNLAVFAHIVRRAIESSFGLAFAIVAAWAVADWALGHVLFDA
ncbi:MAG TPA: hypothetical protein VHE32_07865 [Rhodanobacteraceae bacterium]|nr:hypothetical protein [Rhodanobacteraceae bacterium]